MNKGLNKGTNHNGAKVAGKLAGTINEQEHKNTNGKSVADAPEKKKKRALSHAEVLYPAKDTSP